MQLKKQEGPNLVRSERPDDPRRAEIHMSRSITGRVPYFPATIEGRYGYILRLFFRFLFSRIGLFPDQIKRIKSLADRGTIVYVLKSRSGLESLLCHYQAQRYGLPAPVFACDSRLTLFHSLRYVSRGLLNALSGRAIGTRDPYRSRFIQEQLRAGRPVILYLQDMEAFIRRFLRSGRDPFLEVLEAQQQLEGPIFMIPQMVIWDRAQERIHPRLDELILGKRANPPEARVLFNLFRFYRKDSYVSQAEPLNLKAFLSAREGEDLQDRALALRKELLERLKMERRLVTGPVARSRQELMERVLLDERVQQAIHRRANRHEKSEKAVRKEAYNLIKEIAADFDPNFLRFWDRIMNWALRKLYSGLEIDKEGLSKLREAARHANLVLVPSHKSHVDYMILAYILYNHNMFPPLIAAGLNLAFWPMGFLFRKSGAFFIRRDFRGSVLYPAIFMRYIRVLLEEGYPLEFFIEGGRSRSGKLILPKLGLISMLIDGYRSGACEDLAFVPVAIAYERIMEETAYIREIEGGEKRKESIWGLLRSRHLIRRNYGKIYVTFNEPISLKAYLARTVENPEAPVRYKRHDVPEYLAREIAHNINRAMVVVPTALVSAAVLSSPSPRGFSRHEMLKLAQLFYSVLKQENARFSSSLEEEHHFQKVLKETMDHLQTERLIHRVNVAGEETYGNEEDALFETHDRNRRRLDYYKNSILHYFLPYAFASASFLADGRSVVPQEKILDDAAFLRDLFRQEFVFPEFVFPPEAGLPGPICDALDSLVQLTLLYRIDGGYAAPSGRRQDLLACARLIQSYFESYFVVGSSLKHLAHRRVSQRRFLWRVRYNGYRLYQTGRIRLPESLSQLNFQSAVHSLVDKRVILRQSDKSFRDGGIYLILTPERRRLHWGRIKRFLRLYR